MKSSLKRLILDNRKVERYAIFLCMWPPLLLIIYFAARRIELSQQFVVAWGLTFFLFFFRKLFSKPPLRIIFVLVASYIAMRYIFWRTFDTLLYTGPADFIGMMLLYFSEVYCLVVHTIGMFTRLWPLERKVLPLGEVPPHKLPTVDIFVPTYNEDEELVRITVTAANGILYPKDKMNIYILDDGSTVAKRNNPKSSSDAWQRYLKFKGLARELGVHYITREENGHAKAGNINHAMHYSKGELILILDCDHVPCKDFLMNTVGWFLKDKKLFLAQTPHNFINPDPVEKNMGGFFTAPSESEMFYRGVLPGLDFWNASYFCGSAAVLRRKYVEEVGGISGDTITEDAETAVSLHNKGYNSVYLNRPMVSGLSPESFDDFIIQRTRWAQGMVQIFILKNPLLQRGMSVYQRLCYFNSCIFWFFGVTRMIFFLAPACFLILGLKVYHASIIQVLAYAVPHVFCSFIIMDFLHGKYRWPLFSELYETVQSLFLVPAIFSVIMKPKHPTFKVTPKGQGMEVSSLSHHALPFYVMISIALISIPFGLMKWYYNPLFRDPIIVTLIWNIFNLLMISASLGSFWEKKQVRTFHRAWAKGKVTAYFRRVNKIYEGEIKDISASGMGVELPLTSPMAPEEEVWLKVMDSYGEKYNFQCRVLRQFPAGRAFYCGCEFLDQKKHFGSIVRFAYGDSKRWMDIWDRKSRPISTRLLLTYLARMSRIGIREGIKGLGGYLLLVTKKYLVYIFSFKKYLRLEKG